MATDIAALPTVTTSERGSLKRCPQQWWWRYRLGYRPRFETPDALWFGIGVHIALADWYQLKGKRGRHPADTFLEWIGDEFREIRATGEWTDEPIYEDAKELGVEMLTGYVNRYGKDSDWDILAIEQPFQIIIEDHGTPVCRFRSTWDGVLRMKSTRKVWLLENKTAREISTAYLENDPQAGAYWAMAGPVLRKRGILRPDEQIEGIVYNFLRKSRPDDRPENGLGEKLNKDGTVSKKQPLPNFHREPIYRDPREIATQYQHIADEVALMNLYRSGALNVTKTQTKDCPKFCEFWTMCALHEHGGDSWKEVAEADFTQENPYDRYTKSAGSSW